MSLSSPGKKVLTALSLATATALTSCTGGTDQTTETVQVEVFAAASLNAAGADLEKAFESANANIDVVFNYAGSSKLVQQIQQGATPDLLVTADTATMKTGQDTVSELAEAEIIVVATNRLVLATAADNPAGIQSLEDLADTEVTTALCAIEVPCGTLAHQQLEQAGITLGTATEEPNVSQVATKIATGTVDAGFIYSTDAAALKKDQNITEIPLNDLEPNSYPMALTNTGKNKEAARQFADWLSGEEAQKILADYGFGAAH